jgi:hypothetical protein
MEEKISMLEKTIHALRSANAKLKTENRLLWALLTIDPKAPEEEKHVSPVDPLPN